MSSMRRRAADRGASPPPVPRATTALPSSATQPAQPAEPTPTGGAAAPQDDGAPRRYGLAAGQILPYFAAAFPPAVAGLIYFGRTHGVPAHAAVRWEGTSLVISASSPEGYLHVGACVTFAVAFVVSFTVFLSQRGAKRSVALSVSFINLVSAVTYYALATGSTPVFKAHNGTVVEPIRYLQWMFTTPQFIVLLACLLPQPTLNRDVKAALLLDEVMLVTGLAERFCPPALQFALLLTSCAAFTMEMRHMMRLFEEACLRLALPADRSVLRRLRRITLAMWHLFPAARLAAIAGALTPAGEEVAYVALDLLAKLVYSISLMVANYTLIDQVMEDRLSRYAELFQFAQTQEEDAAALAGLHAAYAEAEAWRRQRQQHMAAAGLPPNHAHAFLDAAVSEYVALAQGQLDIYGARATPPLRAPRGRAG